MSCGRNVIASVARRSYRLSQRARSQTRMRVSAHIHNRSISFTAKLRCDATESEPAIEVPDSSETKTFSPKVTAIVDDISQLNLLEVVDLVDALKTKLNISDAQLAPAAVAMPSAAGPAAGAAAEEAAEPVEEKTEFDVKLSGFDDKAKIKVIKEVRAITNLGLKEAKEFVENSPNVVKTGLTKEEAEEIVEKLKAVGGQCEIE